MSADLKHLLSIRELSREQFFALLESARGFLEVSERDIKKVPALRGKTVINLFLESSTRTRSSFEIAAKRLSADTINIGASDSSVGKGESLLDTAQTLQAMSPDILIIRHRASGAAHFLAKHLSNVSVVNAGDGMHEHPTQALLDCLTIRQHFNQQDREATGLKVAIVGDVLHSRVARSNIWAQQFLGNHVTLIGPPTLLPAEFAKFSNVKLSHDLKAGIKDSDVVICLRMQLERQSSNFVPSLNEYSREFCVSEKILSRYAARAVVLHPGPVNRGVEVSGEVAYGPRSLVNKQVTSGVAVRMAVLFYLSTCKDVSTGTALNASNSEESK